MTRSSWKIISDPDPSSSCQTKVFMSSGMNSNKTTSLVRTCCPSLPSKTRATSFVSMPFSIWSNLAFMARESSGIAKAMITPMLMSNAKILAAATQRFHVIRHPKGMGRDNSRPGYSTFGWPFQASAPATTFPSSAQPLLLAWISTCHVLGRSCSKRKRTPLLLLGFPISCCGRPSSE